MLELARVRAGNLPHRVSSSRRAGTLPLAPAEYDLIVTHFFLDCFDGRDLERLIDRVRARRGTRRTLDRLRVSPAAMGRARCWARCTCFSGVTTGLTNPPLTDHRPLLAKTAFVFNVRRNVTRRPAGIGALAAVTIGRSQ